MRKTFYTRSEIDAILLQTKADAEAAYTLEHMKKAYPIDRGYAHNNVIQSEEYIRECYVDIDDFIKLLQARKEEGANTIQFSWSYGDWAEDEPLTMNAVRQEFETESEHLLRLTRTKERLVYNDMDAKKRELEAHNQRVYEYERLKKQFGE